MNPIKLEQGIISIPTWEIKGNTSIYPNSTAVLNEVTKTFKIDEIQKILVAPRNYLYKIAADNKDTELTSKLDSLITASHESSVRMAGKGFYKNFFWPTWTEINPYSNLIINFKSGERLILPMYLYEHKILNKYISEMKDAGISAELILRQDLDPKKFSKFDDSPLIRAFERRDYKVLILFAIGAVILFFGFLNLLLQYL
jgi:hypothetical protein